MLLSATSAQAGILPYGEFVSREQERLKEKETPEVKLTEDEAARFEIISRCNDLFDEARRAREPYETFDQAWDLYINNVFPKAWPNWRAKISIAKVRAFITFMVAIMTDNKPRLAVEPLVPGSEDAADLLRKLVDRDWDANDMQQKVATFVLYGLIWGTAFMKVGYDPYGDGGRGKHFAIPIVPYRVYTNRTATCIEDAEYLIHVEDMTLGWIQRNFPEKAAAVYGLMGITQPNGEYERNRDFIREGEGEEAGRVISAQNVNGNITAPQYSSGVSDELSYDRDTVEIKEYLLRDNRYEKFERQKIVGGKPQTKDVLDKKGDPVYEVVSHRMEISEIDGAPFMHPVRQPKQEPVMETAWRPMFPNGRKVLIAADRVLLQDIPQPYQTDGFNWAMWKDYDVGSFWGQGEPLALKDLVIASNRIVTEVYNILDKIGNPSYKIEKGAGINTQQIKNKPGMLIPMDNIKAMEALEKPPIPQEFFQLYEIVRKASAEVSGINDSITGQMPASNTAFATIDQLTEAGSAPIRLKVRNLESGLTRIGRLRVQLLQQYQAVKGPQKMRNRDEDMPPEASESGEGEGAVVDPAANVNVRFVEYSNADLQGQVEFSIVPISSLSTSPASVWNKWTQMKKDGLIDRRWFHSKMRIEGFRTELPRMEAEEAAKAAAEAAAKDKSKAKPGPKSNNQSKRGRRRPAAPPSNMGR